jgi:ubiquinone/menaquinone biosynthesis C-methylase UbiE
MPRYIKGSMKMHMNTIPEQIKDENRSRFDTMSKEYDGKRRIEYTMDNSRSIIDTYEKLLKIKIPDVSRLLVLGCGSGYLLLDFALAGKAKEIYGMDISSGMIDICRQHAEELGLTINLQVGDAENLQYPDNYFDMVIGHAVLHHIPDVQKVFNGIYRVLKPNGLCFFTEPSKTGSWIILVIQRVIWCIPVFIRWFLGKTKINIELHKFSPIVLEKIAEKSGLYKVRTEPFAGFLSRIIYWVFDPLLQRVHCKWLTSIINAMINLTSYIDWKIFVRIVPKGWFDEIAVIAEK